MEKTVKVNGVNKMNLLTKRIIFLFLIVLGLIFFVIDDDLSYMEIIGFCIIGLSAGVFCLIKRI